MMLNMDQLGPDVVDDKDTRLNEDTHSLSQRASMQLLASCEPQGCRVPEHDTEGGLSLTEYYTACQWTADGTCLITSSSNQSISTFILPNDLLQQEDEPRRLQTQSNLRLPEPTQAVAPAPYFSLAEPASQTVLTACRDHPLHIYHALAGAPDAVPLATYKLIKAETEAYINPSSLLWSYPGTHFICGSMNRIDYFDVNRYGSDGPILTVPTLPSKKHMSRGYGVGMKGQISALCTTVPDEHGSSIVSAGTRTRWIGMYDIHRTEKAIANWAISGVGGLGVENDTGGRGIVQLAWSPCGRYLVVNERNANALLVYDIRGTGKLLSLLEGRTLSTQQRLTCDVFAGSPDGEGGFEVWAGTEDGSVLVWDRVGNAEGAVQASWDWKAHESSVGSTALHASGSVVATCSGGWTYPDRTSDGEGFLVENHRESSLKVWSLMNAGTEETVS